jgi:hypothetical protein
MTTTQDLLDHIRGALGAAIAPSLTTASAGDDLFEAFLLAKLVEAAKLEGATVTYRDVTGRAATVLVLRTSPGQIYSTRQNYGHAVIEFGARPALEAHTGIFVTGVSGVPHECDLALLHLTEAENCRRNRTVPRRHTLIMAVEAKFYSARLKLDLARSFIGLGKDIGKNTAFMSNSESPLVARMLNKHASRKWYERITPDEAERVTAYFRDVLVGHRVG